MNEELKHKIHSIYGQLMQKKKLKQAWDKVKANKGAGGVDKNNIIILLIWKNLTKSKSFFIILKKLDYNINR